MLTQIGKMYMYKLKTEQHLKIYEKIMLMKLNNN